MSDQYIGEIRIFGGNYAPVDWAFCDGALIPIAQNSTLYNLIGTTYGGDGQNTFALPDLRGRVVAHQGSLAGTTYTMGMAAGAESVTLTTGQLPLHSHTVLATTAIGDTTTPTASTMLATTGPSGTTLRSYGAYGGTQNVSSTGSTTAVGGNQPHDNMQPYLGVNFIIALSGIYPSQN